MITTVINKNIHITNKSKNFSQRKYPRVILTAFKYDYDKCEIFCKRMYELMHGRHVLKLSPLNIYDLQNGNIKTKKKALTSFYKLEDAAKLNIEALSYRSINRLADFAFNMIYKGIETKLDNLDLNCFMSANKIVNSGNVMKNHNGIKTYGGSTIRDFLTHSIKKEKKSVLVETDLMKINNFATEMINTLKKYDNIKSIPFSIFRCILYVRVNKEGEIISPDIEAKDNLRKIVGTENYNRHRLSELSIKYATALEFKFIKQIKKTLLKEINSIVNNMLIDFPEGKFKEHIILASEIENITTITGSGIIHDIANYIETNINNIMYLNEHKSEPISPECQKSLFQIEYTTMRADRNSGVLWLSEISEAIKAKYATFEKLKLCIESEFAPIINDRSVLDYDISYENLKAFYKTYIFDKSRDELLMETNNILNKLAQMF